MPNRQRHRGSHPGDERLFAPANLDTLRAAVADVSWLFARGYTPNATLKLVGDRYALRKRQRDAVLRSACTDEQRARRSALRRDTVGGRVAVDGFNAIIILESMLSGGPIVIGRDGAFRDIASVHGSYRRVEETPAAIRILGDLLEPASEVHWYFDSPISNSGRIAAMVRDEGERRSARWQVEAIASPDRALLEADGVSCATTDSWILDNLPAGGGGWVDLAALAVGRLPVEPWMIDLCEPSKPA